MQKLDKKTLDEIGKAVVKAGTLSSRDIDAITADPALFDSVRARINFVTTGPARTRLLSKTFVGSFASIVVVTAVAFGLVIFRSKPIYSVSDPTPVTPRNPVTKSFAQPDKVTESDFARNSSPVRAERISSRPEAKFTRPKQSAAQRVRYDGDFYALSYAGDPNETERGGRIVRVDIPRSTLFAMGVDVPLENETETVKADLLIGSDGVTRAIRVVK
jgi:hypothetical protein